MSEHYFSAQESRAEPLKSQLHKVTVSTRGQELELQSSDAVFSAGALDRGTAQLLKKAPPLPPAGTFLDLGCGWGAVAAVMASESPGGKVWAVDVNHRALSLTRLNAQTLGLTNVVVEDAPRALEEAQRRGIRFDVIWSNPPVRIGKAAMRAMLVQWLNLLSADGRAFLVVNRHLGADSLATWLETQQFAVSRLASRKGYRILQVSRL